MAIHQRTTRQAFPLETSSLASATRRDLSAITLYNPMTTSRTWRSVIVRVWARLDETSAKDVTSRLVGIKLGAASFQDLEITDTIANSGKHGSLYFEVDVTSYFVTNWTSGATKTCQVGVKFGGVATINIAVEVVMTFDAEDSNTRIRTAEIPLESFTGLLTNALVEMGTNQIPILTGGSGVLPEPSPTIRDWYIRCEGNEADGSGTTDYALGLQIDSDTEFVSGNFRQNLASSCYFGIIYSRAASVPTTTAAHAFKARSVATTSRIIFAATLVVTYEYDHTTTPPRVWNGVKVPLLPITARHQASPGDVTDVQRFQAEIWIPEPGTITLEQSGVLVHYGGAKNLSNWTMSLAVGAQAARGYTVPAVSATFCGGLAHAQRIDSGSAQGAALTLARGRNVINFDHYANINDGSVPHPILFLNYTSDGHEDGDGNHNRTVEVALKPNDVVAAAKVTSAAIAPVLPEAAVRFNAVGFRSTVISAADYVSAYWLAEVLAEEAAGKGWISIQGGAHATHANRGVYVCPGDGSPAFKRWTGDPDVKRLDPLAARRWRLEDGTVPTSCLTMLLTYHSIARSLPPLYFKNFPSGDGSGIPVTLHRADTGELLLEGATIGGGRWEPTWLDDTVAVKAVFRHSSNFRAVTDDL